MQSVRRWLSLLIYLIGGVFFLALGIAIVKNYVTRDPSYFVMLAAGTLIFGVAASISNLRIPSWLYYFFIGVVFLMMVVLHRYCVVELQAEYLYGDAAEVIKNSRSFALIGKYDPTGAGSSYFARYQNQFGILIIFRLFFQFTQAVFHTTDDACLYILNQFAMDLSILLTIVLAEKLGKEHHEKNIGLFVAVLCLFAPFLSLYVTSLYTDVLCLPFIMGGILLSTRIYGKPKRRKKSGSTTKTHIWKDFLSIFVLGILLGIGYKIKGNVIILLIAIIMASFFCLSPIKWFKSCTVLVLSFGCVLLATSFYIKAAGMLTDEESDLYKFPATHWIMMGMDGCGTYNDEDVHYTWSFPNYAERKEGVSIRLKEKAKAAGVSGLIDHAFFKATQYAWNSGTFGVAHFHGDVPNRIRPLRSSWMHEYIQSKGEHNPDFSLLANVFWLLLLIPMALSFFLFRRRMSFSLLTCQLFLIGTLFFFMLWETDQRYIFSSSLLVLTIAALQWKSLARIPAHILTARHCDFAQLPCFLNYEEKIRQEMAYGEEELASFHMKLYASFIRMLNEKHYKSFKKRFILLRRELKSIKMQRDLDEKISFFLETWEEPDNCDAEELHCARITGQRLLDDVDAMDLRSKPAKQLRKWMRYTASL